MPNGDWRPVAAFGTLAAVLLVAFGLLIWDYSALQTEQRVRYEQAARAYTEQAAERIESECAADLGPVAMRACIREKIETAEDQKRAERDLDAQETMARFTRLMGYTGVFGIFIGVGSIYLIWATLLATQRMAGDTQRIGEAQVRAYVSADAADMIKTDEGLEFRLRIRNSGNSPAKRVNILIQRRIAAVADGMVGHAVDGPSWALVMQNDEGSLASRQELEYRWVIPHETIRHWNEPSRLSKRELFVRGRVRYETIFGVVADGTHHFSFLIRAGELIKEGRLPRQPGYHDA